MPIDNDEELCLLLLAEIITDIMQAGNRRDGAGGYFVRRGLLIGVGMEISPHRRILNW